MASDPASDPRRSLHFFNHEARLRRDLEASPSSERVRIQVDFSAWGRQTVLPIRQIGYGDALVEYWRDAHDDRNALFHRDNDFSPYVIQPMSADDIMESLDPMLSLYRYLLIGDPRPQSLR